MGARRKPWSRLSGKYFTIWILQQTCMVAHVASQQPFAAFFPSKSNNGEIFPFKTPTSALWSNKNSSDTSASWITLNGSSCNGWNKWLMIWASNFNLLYSTFLASMLAVNSTFHGSAILGVIRYYFYVVIPCSHSAGSTFAPCTQQTEIGAIQTKHTQCSVVLHIFVWMDTLPKAWVWDYFVRMHTLPHQMTLPRDHPPSPSFYRDPRQSGSTLKGGKWNVYIEFLIT